MKNISKKQTFTITIALIFVFLALLMTVLTLGISKKGQKPKLAPRPQAGAALSLEPNRATVKVDQTFSLGIRVEVSHGKATGVEAIISFDPAFLEAVDGDKEKEGLQAVKAGFFDEYLGNKIDNQNGRVVVSGINLREQFNQGTIGVVLFQAKKKGKTEVNFVFAPGEKSESDVAAPGGKDILTKTFGAEVAIK